MARQKKIDLEHMTEKEKMKYEIAGELGLLERVLNDGWRSLTAKETGRIGGLVTRRKLAITLPTNRAKLEPFDKTNAENPHKYTMSLTLAKSRNRKHL